MADEQVKTFLEEERERIELRLAQIITVERPQVEAQLEALTHEYIALEKMFEAAGGTKTPTVRTQPAKPRPKRGRRPSKGKGIRVPDNAVDRMWAELRQVREGATVKEMAEKMSFSESYVRYGFKQLVEAKRATVEDGVRDIGGRDLSVQVYKIVSPQREGSNAPPSRPRQPTPEQEVRRGASKTSTPQRGAPVPGTGRRPVVLPHDKDTANIVLEAVKQGWHTQKDGKEHIRVIRDEVKDEQTGDVTVKRAEVRVSSTPNSPSLDRIRKEFGEHGVVYDKR